jgi:hypothetical protein
VIPERKKLSADELLADDMGRFYADPLGFVIFAFPWDTDRSIQLVPLPDKYQEKYGSKYGPDAWACEFLEDLGAQVIERGFDGLKAVEPIQFATASGHGIGKSALTSWLILWIMSTRPYARGTVTANTADQLKTKTWAQLGYWHGLCVTGHWFDYNSGRGAMSLTHKDHKQSWRCDAQTCREENSEAFAGQHAANSTSFYIFDEASAVPDKIYEVREGGLTDGEPMTFDFGNPTRNTGRFYENCVGKFKHRHRVRCIDSRDVSITNKELFQRWVDDYGEDSDYVKVRVRGTFPSAGSLQFIPTDSVDAAVARDIFHERAAPIILGVDVARFGDDESVIFTRVGRDARTYPAQRFRGLDTVQLAGKVADTVRDFKSLGRAVSAIFVDGTGVGGGVVDQLRAMNYDVHEVQFGTKPIDALSYRYKSDEMWGKVKEALRIGALALPDDDDLHRDLTQRQYGHTLKGAIHLETKKDMKARGVDSPDLADALALTYAQDVQPTLLAGGPQHQQQAISEYNPYESAW